MNNVSTNPNFSVAPKNPPEPKKTYVTYVEPSTSAKTKSTGPEALRGAVFNSTIWALVSTVLLGDPMNVGVPQDTPNGHMGGVWGQIPNTLDKSQQILIRRTILASILDVNIKAVQGLMNVTYNPFVHAPLESLRTNTLVATETPITKNVALNAVNKILTNIQNNPNVINKILSDDGLNDNNIETLNKINEKNCFKNEDFSNLLLTAVDSLDAKGKKSVLEKCKELGIECKDSEGAKAVFKKYIDQCVEKYTQPFCGGFDEFICNFSELFGPVFIKNVGQASGLSFGFLIFTTLITGYATNQCIMNEKLNANRNDTLLLNTVVDKRPFSDKLTERVNGYTKNVEDFFTEKKFLKTLQGVSVNTFFDIVLRLAAETPFIFGANAVGYNPNIGAANLPAAIANTVRGCLGGTIFGDIKAKKRGEFSGFLDDTINSIKNSRESNAKEKIYTLLDIDRQCDEKLAELDNIKKDIKEKLSVCLNEKDAIDNPIELLKYVLDTKQYKQTSSLTKKNIEQIINNPEKIKQIIARCDQFNDFLEYAKKQTSNSPIILNDDYALIYPDFAEKANLKLKMPNKTDKEIYHIFKNKQKVIDMAKIYYLAIDSEFEGVENQINGLKKIIERKKYQYYKKYNNPKLEITNLANNMHQKFRANFEQNQQNKGFDVNFNKKADIPNPRITIPEAAEQYCDLNTNVTAKATNMIEEYHEAMAIYKTKADKEFKDAKLHANKLIKDFNSTKCDILKTIFLNNIEKDQIDDYGRYNDDNYNYESYWNTQIINFCKEEIQKANLHAMSTSPFLISNSSSTLFDINNKEHIKKVFEKSCNNFIKMKQNDAAVGQECLKLQDIKKLNTNVYQTINEIDDITAKFCEASFNKKSQKTKLASEQNNIGLEIDNYVDYPVLYNDNLRDGKAPLAELESSDDELDNESHDELPNNAPQIHRTRLKDNTSNWRPK